MNEKVRATLHYLDELAACEHPEAWGSDSDIIAVAKDAAAVIRTLLPADAALPPEAERYARITIRNPRPYESVKLEICGKLVKLAAEESVDYCLGPADTAK